MATIADLKVRIGADLKNFQKGMGNLQKGLDQAGRKMRSVGKTLSIGLTAPLVAFGAKSLQLFDQQQQALAQVESAVKSTAGAAGFAVEELARQAAALQSNTIFGDEEILKQVTANLLTFTSIAGDEFVRTQGLVLDLSTRMGTDLTSATIQLGKALNDPVANLGALSRAGIQFSKEQKEVIKSLVETGQKAEAQRVILEELERQFGGAAEAAAAAGLGGFKQLKNSIGDLMESIGETMLPMALKITDAISGVVKAFQAMSPETKKTIVIVGGLAAALGPVIFVLGGLAASISAIASFLVLIAPLFTPVVAGVAALAAVALIIYRNWNLVTEAFFGTIDAIENLVTGSLSTLLGTVEGLFGAVALALKGDFQSAWEALKETVSTYGADVVTEVSGFVNDVGAATAPLAWNLMFDPLNMGALTEEGLLGKFNELMGGVSGSARSNLDTGDNSVKSSADKAKNALAKIKTEVGNIEALAPSFKTLEDALSGAEVSADDAEAALADISTKVDDIEALAPSFATLRRALGIGQQPDVNSIVFAAFRAGLGIQGIGDEVAILEKVTPDLKTITDALNAPTGSIASHANEAKGAVKDLYDLIPSELEMPEGYEDITQIIPDANETHRWSKFVLGVKDLAGFLSTAKQNAYNVARYMRDIKGALDTLGIGPDTPFGKFVGKIAQAALDVTSVIGGFQALAELLKAETWRNILEDALGLITGIVEGINRILTAGSGPRDFTGGDPGILIPGAGGTGGAGGATAASAISGAPTIGGIPLATAASLFAVFGRSMYQLAGFGGTETPWVSMGISRDEWIQQQIASGGYATIAGNLMGGADLSWLTGDGGGTPSWLSGLQGYMGGGAGAPALGMGVTSGGQTINVNLDGQTIATATAPYWSDELHIYGTNV